MGATSTLLLSVTMRVSLRAAWHAPIAESVLMGNVMSGIVGLC
jgi:hypothetical protein